MAPAYSESFPERLGLRGQLPVNVSDLGLSGDGAESHGTFTVASISGTGIRVTYKGGGDGSPSFLRMGYRIDNERLKTVLRPGQELVLIAKCRFRSVHKIPSEAARPHLFLEDPSAEHDRNDLAVYKSTWDEYLLNMDVDSPVDAVYYGFTWNPAGKGDWFEIDDVRLYVR
jgi:hypothetical protein